MVRTRSRRSLCTFILLTLFACGANAQPLEVFACEPEWAALVRILAPDARITTATHARQDPHHIEARPALISGLRRARLAVCTGASLEAGWLPTLQQRASNPDVQAGRDGMFFAAEFVDLIDKRPDADRSMGDVHAEGNPHFHLDPDRLKQVSAALAERLAVVDPGNAGRYRQRHQAWARDWDRRVARWIEQAKPLEKRGVVAQHTTFAYLWQWLGIRQMADLEPKPGSPPTAAHLQRVLRQLEARGERPFAVVQALYQDPQATSWFVDRVSVPLLVLPATVTSEGPASDLGGLFDLLILELLRAAKDGSAGGR